MVRFLVASVTWCLTWCLCCRPCEGFQRSRTGARFKLRQLSQLSDHNREDDADVIVIGSGIGGLSCAAILAASGRKVLVLESHEHFGGVAHEWKRGGFRFESGPSLFAGLSAERSPNPLKHVFQMVGEEPEWITYDRWGTDLPEGQFAAAVGSEDFIGRILPTYGGPEAVEQWERLMTRVRPLGEAIFALPSAAVREDPFAFFTLGLRYGPALIRVLAAGGDKLSKPFALILEEEGITDPFIRNWLDMICFLLQGTTTKEAPTTLMAYMLCDFYRPGVVLDYPKGGSSAIVAALVRAVEKHPGCEVRARSHVQGLLIDDELRGVVLKGGEELRARQVVSNADLWSTRKLLPDGPVAAYLDAEMVRVERCGSFLHLHLGINATGLPAVSAEFPAQWAVLDSWDRGVDAERNLVLVSVASLLDSTMAPENCHVIHAYVPATEPWDRWANCDDYQAQKAEAVQVLWRAIEKYIPDVRSRVILEFDATPQTHARYTRRDSGSYGARLSAESGEQLMGHSTPLKGFWLCGDSTFPGIGVPAVAASGIITANSILSPIEHWRNLDKIRI